MAYTIIVLSIICTLIIVKLKDITLRNKLNDKDEKRLLIAGSLLILFFVTKVTLPYPESLYWFLFLSVIGIGSILCIDILKIEFKRFRKLKTKDMILNIAFYCLFIVVTHLFV